MITFFKASTSCPSGLRSHVKAVVLIGAGSNPADVIFCLSFGPPLDCAVGVMETLILLYRLAFTKQAQCQYLQILLLLHASCHTLQLFYSYSFFKVRSCDAWLDLDLDQPVDSKQLLPYVLHVVQYM